MRSLLVLSLMAFSVSAFAQFFFQAPRARVETKKICYVSSNTHEADGNSDLMCPRERRFHIEVRFSPDSYTRKYITGSGDEHGCYDDRALAQADMEQLISEGECELQRW